MAVGCILYTPKPALTQADVVNHLLGTSGKLPLSDLQGNILNEKIAKIGSYETMQSGTILDAVNNTTENKCLFIVQGYIPEDSPIQAEGFLEIKVQKGNSRKQVIYHRYSGGSEVFSRSVFNGKWLTNWTEYALKSEVDNLIKNLTAEQRYYSEYFLKEYAEIPNGISCALVDDADNLLGYAKGTYFVLNIKSSFDNGFVFQMANLCNSNPNKGTILTRNWRNAWSDWLIAHVVT